MTLSQLYREALGIRTEENHFGCIGADFVDFWASAVLNMKLFGFIYLFIYYLYLFYLLENGLSAKKSQHNLQMKHQG